MKTRYLLGLATFTGLALSMGGSAHAGTTTVLATDDLYNASGVIDGTTPSAIAVAGATSITFAVSSGATVTVNGGGNFNDADGVGSAQGENNSGTTAISGISSPTAGYIAGVFYSAGAPLPTALNFDGPGGTSFAILSPLLDQAFFIGDGLTGDQTGATQTFDIPTGATSLYLGLTDACGYNGGPSCYDDNSGSFTVTYNETGVVTPPPPPPSGVPEPGSLPVFAAALGIAGLIRWRVT